MYALLCCDFMESSLENLGFKRLCDIFYCQVVGLTLVKFNENSQ